MGKRLTGFDYSRPMFYMVTIKCRKGVRALCEIVAPGKCQLSAITRAMVNCIRNFHLGCEAIAPIECFSIMPDHIHLLIRIVDKSTTLKRDGEARISNLKKVGSGGRNSLKSRAPIRLLRLETIVDLLMQALEGRYREVTGLREQVFEAGWHDWIVVAEGQLAAFTRYIRENPRRAFLREKNRCYFTRVRRVAFAGREWFAYGNAALLELPVIEPFRCSRKWVKDDAEWREAVGRAERLGPGGAGVGTFMSTCEKACGNAIYKAGGSLIVLSPEGFAPRWHPPRNKEALCAKGRMLFLSLWEPCAAKPDNATLYQRCHEMGDVMLLGAKRLSRSQTLKSSGGFAGSADGGRAGNKPAGGAESGRAGNKPASGAESGRAGDRPAGGTVGNFS